MIEFDEAKELTIITVRVIPRSSKTEIVGEHDGAIKIKLKSPPVEGAANDELVGLLAKLLDLAKSDLEIVSGAASRTKRIRICGRVPANIAAILRAKI